MKQPREAHWVAEHTSAKARLSHRAQRDMALGNTDRPNFQGAVRDEVARRNESLRYHRMSVDAQNQSPIAGENGRRRPGRESENVNIPRLLCSAFFGSCAIVLIWLDMFVDPPTAASGVQGLAEHRLSMWAVIGAGAVALAPYLSIPLRPSRAKREPILPRGLAGQVSPERQRELFIEDHATEKDVGWNEHREFLFPDIDTGK